MASPWIWMFMTLQNGAVWQNNLAFCKEHSSKNVTFNILTDNYILSQYLDFNYMIGGNMNPVKYDFVIGNPPYMKIPKDAPEATAMPAVC